MEREYAIFERLSIGPVRVGNVMGLDAVREKLASLSKETSNEYFAMDLETKQVVERVNSGSKKKSSKFWSW
jgi:3-hydroxyacyl-CoA dehydrogenase